MSLDWSVNENPISSTKMKKMTIRHLTTAEKDAIPAGDKDVGDIVYDRDLGKHQKWNGSSWVDILTPTGGVLTDTHSADPVLQSSGGGSALGFGAGAGTSNLNTGVLGTSFAEWISQSISLTISQKCVVWASCWYVARNVDGATRTIDTRLIETVSATVIASATHSNVGNNSDFKNQLQGSIIRSANSTIELQAKSDAASTDVNRVGGATAGAVRADLLGSSSCSPCQCVS